MSFFQRQDIGRLYVVKLVLPNDTVVHKVGMCYSARSTERMMEILKSWFSSYRFVPYTELKLDMQCNNAVQIETYIHKILRSVSFEPTFKVDGSTEMFVGVNEKRLLWFLRSLNCSNYVTPPAIADEQAKILCNLLTVDYEH